MHVSDGVLSAPVLAGGAILAASGVAIGLTRMADRDIPRVAVLSSAFFALSSLSIPIPGGHIHLVLCGLMGVLLGWSIFPAVAVALLLQVTLFLHGGWTTLGVNTLSMAGAGLFAAGISRPLFRSRRSIVVSIGGFLAGFVGVACAGAILALSAILSGSNYAALGAALFAANLILAVVEGFLSASILTAIARVRPALLSPSIGLRGETEVVHV